MSLRVLLLDDHKAFRQGLKEVLEASGEIEVVAEASTGEEAIALAQSERPDVAVLDISMPGMDGIEATKKIRELAPGVRVVMLTIQSTSEHLFRASRAGALGYLLKDTAADEVIAAVQAVAEGRSYYSPKVMEYLPLDAEGGWPSVGPLDSLSERERAVLTMLVAGRTNLETAKFLKISERMVEAARSRLMQKLHVHNIPGLVKFAILHGIASLE